MLIWDTNSHFEYNYIDFKDISEMIMPWSHWGILIMAYIWNELLILLRTPFFHAVWQCFSGNII